MKLRDVRRDAPEALDLPDPPARAADPADVIRILAPMLTDERKARIASTIASRTRSVVAVLEDLADPHNGAAVLRTADALGVHEVHVIEARHRFLVGSGVSKGAARWLDVRRHASAVDCVTGLRARGYRVLVAALDGVVTPDELASIERVAIVFGNEHGGVSDALRGASDGSYCIPMRGFVESLNVSVAAAITLHSAMRGRSGDLDARERIELEARFVAASIEHADVILQEMLERERNDAGR